MSIKEDLGIATLENQLEEYNNKEDYERARGFDEQDEYLHLVCTKQRQIENEINQSKEEYENELDKYAHLLAKDTINRFIEDLEDNLYDYSDNYTNDDDEREEITIKSYDIINNIFNPPKTSIVSLKYETKFSKINDLVLVTETEYNNDDRYTVDKNELLHFLIINTIKESKKVAENCYKIRTNDSVFYIICPLSASETIKQEYKEVINILN